MEHPKDPYPILWTLVPFIVLFSIYKNFFFLIVRLNSSKDLLKKIGHEKECLNFAMVVLKGYVCRKHIYFILCILRSHYTMTACTFLQCKKTNNWKTLKGSCHVFNTFLFSVLHSFVVAIGKEDIELITYCVMNKYILYFDSSFSNRNK